MMQLSIYLLVPALVIAQMKRSPKCLKDAEADGLEKWEDVIPEGYKQHDVPQLEGSPLPIMIGLYPQGIPDISVEKMTMEVDFYVSLMWQDCRLNVPPTFNGTVPSEIASKLWTPRVIMSNGVGTKPIKFDAERHTISVIFGRFYYYTRLHVSFYCTYDLSAYPMDTQKCELEIISGNGLKEVKLLDSTQKNYEQSLEGKTPPQCIVTENGRTNCSDNNVFTTMRSCIAMYFVMERPIPFHLIVTYVPSMLIVILSWVSFWLDIDASAPRVTLGLTSLLTLATQFANAQKSLPPVSYIKAIDVWMFACMFMVFASLIQFALANFLYRRVNSTSNQPSSSTNRLRRKTPYSSKVYIFDVKHGVTKKSLPVLREKPVTSSLFDRISRILFPLGFGVFNIFYWSYYLYFF